MPSPRVCAACLATAAPPLERASRQPKRCLLVHRAGSPVATMDEVPREAPASAQTGGSPRSGPSTMARGAPATAGAWSRSGRGPGRESRRAAPQAEAAALLPPRQSEATESWKNRWPCRSRGRAGQALGRSGSVGRILFSGQLDRSGLDVLEVPLLDRERPVDQPLEALEIGRAHV